MYTISMVEVIADSLEYTLIDGLSFKLAKTASSITDRQSCTCQPLGCNIYTPVHRIQHIKSTSTRRDWLDRWAFRIMYVLQITDATAVRRLCALRSKYSFYFTIRRLASGHILENIDMYNRGNEMFNISIASDNNINNYF